MGVDFRRSLRVKKRGGTREPEHILIITIVSSAIVSSAIIMFSGFLYLGLYAAITFRHVPEETGNAVHAGGRLSLFADLVGEPDACRALSSCAETAPPPMLMLRSRALCLESNWVANGSGFGDFGGGSWREHPRRWLGAQWPRASPPRSAEPPRAARRAPRRPRAAKLWRYPGARLTTQSHLGHLGRQGDEPEVGLRVPHFRRRNVGLGRRPPG